MALERHRTAAKKLQDVIAQKYDGRLPLSLTVSEVSE